MFGLDPTRTAVIAVHLQNDVVGAEGALAGVFRAEVERTGVLDTVGQILGAARAAGVPLVYTRVAWQPGFGDMVANAPLLVMSVEGESLVDGTSGAAIVAELTPEPGDLVVTHQRVGGFAASNLDVLLRGRGIDTVVFVGVSTNLSVEGTARVATDLGYRTVVVADACCAATPEAHEASIGTLGLLAEIVTANELVEALRRTTAAVTPSLAVPSTG